MHDTEYSKKLVLDLWKQGFSIKSIIRRVAKKTKRTQQELKPIVEKDLFESILNRPLKKIDW